MSGNGRGVYQGIIPTRCISQSGRGAKTYRRIEMHPVCGGGAFDHSPWSVRCAYRVRDYPLDSSWYRGFRVVVRPAF